MFEFKLRTTAIALLAAFSFNTISLASAYGKNNGDISKPTIVALICSSSGLSADNGYVIAISETDSSSPEQIKDCQRYLKDMNSSLHKMHHLLNDIKRECSQRQSSEIVDPEEIGDVVESGFLSTSNGGGYLPPRKSWLDIYNTSLTRFNNQLKTDYGNSHLTSFSEEISSDQITYLNKNMKLLTDNLAKIKTLSNGPYYDNEEIMKSVATGQSTVKSSSQLVCKMFKALKQKK